MLCLTVQLTYFENGMKKFVHFLILITLKKRDRLFAGICLT